MLPLTNSNAKSNINSDIIQREQKPFCCMCKQRVNSIYASIHYQKEENHFCSNICYSQHSFKSKNYDASYKYSEFMFNRKKDLSDENQSQYSLFLS